MVKYGLRFFRLKVFLVLLFALVCGISVNSYAGINEDLFKAVKKGNIARVAELINKGADINAKDNDGKTALIYAADKGHTEIATLLIDKGANVNAKSNGGKTALMLARAIGHEDIVQLLKAHGAK